MNTSSKSLAEIKKTKIVCTIGPSSHEASRIRALIKAGMDVARINFSHGTHEEHARDIETIRRVARSMRKPVALLQDLPGPKDRTGAVKDGGVQLEGGSYFVLTTRQVLGDRKQVSIDWADLPMSVKLGDLIYLDDGAIKLQVVSIDNTDIRCKVMVGGLLRDHRGINVPQMVRKVSPMTDVDWQHLEFGVEHKVDFIALSFVKDANDIVTVRDFLREKVADIMLIAKIERREALDNLDAILDVADGAMVARGDLGIEIPIENVPIAQKEIIRKCNQRGKPVIVATQMLESMVYASRPTRAEVTDVANAIFDGTDAVMLSQETAIGSYPVETVAMMTKIALETEAYLPYKEILFNKGKDLKPETDDAIGYSACHIAQQVGAVAIIAFTSSGSTARRVSKYRPEVPVLATTTKNETRRQLSLSWGVRAYKVTSVSKIAELFVQGSLVAKESGIARKGDVVVITGGVPIGVACSTNLVKVERIE
jgi:pyruvate kinase